MAFIPQITQAGLAAAAAASAGNTSIGISHIGFGSGTYDPTGTETDMVAEVARKAIASGTAFDNQVRLSAIWDDNSANLSITEIGIWAGTTLFAVWSTSGGDVAGHKTELVDFVAYYDFIFTDIPAGSVTVLEDNGQSALLAALGNHTNDPAAHPTYQRKKRRIWIGESATTGGGTAGVDYEWEISPTANDFFSAYEDGQTLIFRAHVTSGANPTLEVTDGTSGYGAIPIWIHNGVIGTGGLTQGHIYEVMYDDGAWHVLQDISTAAGDGVLDTAVLNGTNLELARTGGLPLLTVDLSTLGGGGSDGVITGAALGVNPLNPFDLTITRSVGADIIVDLSDLVAAGGADGVVTGGFVSGSDIILTTSLGGQITISNAVGGGTADGVVTGGNVTGTNLVLNRSVGGNVTIPINSLLADTYVTSGSTSTSSNNLTLTRNSGSVSVNMQNLMNRWKITSGSTSTSQLTLTSTGGGSVNISLSTFAAQFSLTSHNHSGVYAPVSHTHSQYEHKGDNNGSDGARIDNGGSASYVGNTPTGWGTPTNPTGNEVRIPHNIGHDRYQVSVLPWETGRQYSAVKNATTTYCDIETWAPSGSGTTPDFMILINYDD
jgi:hypothetical protein